MKAGKIWGPNGIDPANGVLEFAITEFKKVTSVPEHEHKFKWNGFLVQLAR